MYSSFDISKKILELAKKENRKVDPMKLLKLVYITHGWHLGFKDSPLINDEIQAWKYGPVIPELYHVIKRFGNFPVDPDLIDLYSDRELDKPTSKFVEEIWNVYKNMSGLELSARTHKEGTVWHTLFDGNYHKVMDNDSIKAHYDDLIKSAKAKQPKEADNA